MIEKNLNLIFAVAIVAILYLITFYSKKFIYSEALVYDSFKGQMSIEQIDFFIRKLKNWEWLSYLSVPLFYIIKIFLISSTLYIIKIIIGKTFKATFSDISLAVIKADMIFLIPALIKITWFTLYPAETLEEIQYFMPGSLSQLFSYTEIPPWLSYPLQAFSIWEVAFWLILAFQLKKYFDNDYNRSLENVMLSYGSGFLVWVVFVVFLTINMT